MLTCSNRQPYNEFDVQLTVFCYIVSVKYVAVNKETLNSYLHIESSQLLALSMATYT